MLRFLLLRTDGDAEARDMLQDSGQSGCEGLVAVLDLVAASDLFVMGVDRMVGVFCFHVVRCCCVVPLAPIGEKVLGE